MEAIEQNFTKLKKKVFEDRGFDFDNYSQDYVKRRLNARMMVLNISKDNWVDYIKIIERDQASEYAKLFDTFSVNVTEFLRDVTVWQSLKEKYLPMLISEKRQAKTPVLKIWSCACSSGEEPYSIAMIMKEIMPKDLQLSITATDIDNDALSKAREGLYRKEQIKNAEKVFPDILKKNLAVIPNTESNSIIHLDNTKYQVSDEIKKMVVFKNHNFLSEPPPPQIDIIFCRNVIIYLTPVMKEKLMEIFFKSLSSHGMLVVGKSEIIFLGKGKDYFYAVDSKEHVYRKERRNANSEIIYPKEKDRRKNWWPGVQRSNSESNIKK